MNPERMVGGLMMVFLVGFGWQLIRQDRAEGTPETRVVLDTVYVTADSTPCAEALAVYKRKTKALQVSLAWERRWDRP